MHEGPNWFRLWNALSICVLAAPAPPTKLDVLLANDTGIVANDNGLAFDSFEDEARVAA
jgi:hypothetical protein